MRFDESDLKRIGSCSKRLSEKKRRAGSATAGKEPGRRCGIPALGFGFFLLPSKPVFCHLPPQREVSLYFDLSLPDLSDEKGLS